jgi:hypothetical protein
MGFLLERQRGAGASCRRPQMHAAQIERVVRCLAAEGTVAEGRQQPAEPCSRFGIADRLRVFVREVREHSDCYIQQRPGVMQAGQQHDGRLAERLAFLVIESGDGG